MQKRATGFLRKSLPWLVLIGAYLFSVGLFARYGQHNLDSDMSSEMILAQMLNEEGKLFSEEWYYSTELRVISPVFLYQMGLRLFDSWHAARTFAVAAMHLCTIAAFLFMASAAGMKESGIYCAAVLVLPISQSYTFLFAYGGFYVAYFIMTCLVMGIVLSISGSKRKALRLALLALLGVFSGMNGVRMVMILGAPLMLACVLMLFGRLRRSGSCREWIQSDAFHMAVAAAVFLAGMMAGYWINGHILSQKYSFEMQDETRLTFFGPLSVLHQIELMFQFFGYQPGSRLLSVEGLASWAAIGLVCFSLGSVCLLLQEKTRSRLTPGQQMVPMFALCALVLGVLLNETTDRGANGYNEIHAVAYYISGVLMMIASAFMLLENLPSRLWEREIRTLLMLMLSAVFVLEARVYTKNEYRSTTANYEDAAQWLLDHGYTQGFSTFWFGNVLTEATDGQMEMYVFSSWAMDELHPWLQKKSHLAQLPEGKVFVYVDSKEALWDPCACTDPERMVYESIGGRAYEYESAQQVMDIQRAYRAELVEQRKQNLK